MIKKLLSIALIVAACQISNAQSFSLYYPFTNCANSFPGPATGSVDPTPAPIATGVVSGSFMAVNQGTYTSSGTGYFGWGGFSV